MMKEEKKQLKQLLGENFESISIYLIQKSKIINKYQNMGDIISMNEHFLHHMFEHHTRIQVLAGTGLTSQLSA